MEIIVVKLKSPKCAIRLKEINQIDRYAFTFEQHPRFSAEKVKYKLILLSSRLNAYAKSKVRSQLEIYKEKL